MPSDLERERAYVAGLYARLDEQRRRTEGRLASVRRAGGAGTPAARTERDALASHYEDALARLSAAETGLCFGRLDKDTGESYHVGRLGLSDDQQRQLLVDWRAPAAQPFYRATPADPAGVVRRRHLRTRGRTVLDFTDDVFDLERLSEADRATLGGDAALLAALNESRTGRMRDIVATIQAEQDAVIRADVSGVLVVQGGPGTGKTAVALHRAAYLLYTHRDRLSRSGVLVVGPNPVFLRYIDRVLPSLGETGVVLAAVDELVPGVVATGREPDAVAALKGDRRMATVVRDAVAAREVVPGGPRVVPFEGVELAVEPAVVAAARRRARRSRRPHNTARYTFARHLLEHLVESYARGDRELMRERWLSRSLMRTAEFKDLVDELWPRLDPRALVGEVLADPDPGGRRLSPAERALLAREPGAAWTPADVPLLDEARDLLGDPDEMVRLAAERRRAREEREYAASVLAMTGTDDLVGAERLAARFRAAGGGGRDSGPARDFGHVIVDEAQELSPMAWRMLLRRCPRRSMTVVGDVAQTSAPWGTTDWAATLDPLLGERWRAEVLTVNYRTPTEIMEVAADVLAAVDPAAKPPSAVRDSGHLPWAREVEPAEVPAAAAAAAAGELARLDEGTLAVIAPEPLLAAVSAAVAAALPGVATSGLDSLDGRVSVLPVAQAKGLEFDAVVVVEPAAVVDGTRRGLRDLYVALTRATQRLGVVHARPLPDVLQRLADRARPAAV